MALGVRVGVEATYVKVKIPDVYVLGFCSVGLGLSSRCYLCSCCLLLHIGVDLLVQGLRVASEGRLSVENIGGCCRINIRTP